MSTGGSWRLSALAPGASSRTTPTHQEQALRCPMGRHARGEGIFFFYRLPATHLFPPPPGSPGSEQRGVVGAWLAASCVRPSRALYEDCDYTGPYIHGSLFFSKAIRNYVVPNESRAERECSTLGASMLSLHPNCSREGVSGSGKSHVDHRTARGSPRGREIRPCPWPLRQS